MESLFDRKVFGARLAEAIKAKGLTQKRAGEIVGESQSRMSEYVHGHYLPLFDKLYTMIQTLGLDTRILFPEWYK
jgi:transcriptional regulator with XRE-family HTH domain